VCNSKGGTDAYKVCGEGMMPKPQTALARSAVELPIGAVIVSGRSEYEMSRKSAVSVGHAIVGIALFFFSSGRMA
jgi:hypothetical protein